MFQEAQAQRKLLYGLFMAQGRPNEVLVREELGRLGHFGRKLAALLNGATRFVKRSVGEQGLRESVCGGHGILNR